MVLSILFSLFVSRTARAERDLLVPFHESGHIVFDQLSGVRLGASDGFSYAGPAGFATRTTRIGTAEAKTTTVWLAPSADVFVTDHLSLGGLVEIGHSWGSVEDGGNRVDLPGTTSLTFLPRAGFFVPVGDRFGVWPRAGLGWRSVESAQLAAGVIARETFRSMLLDVDVSVIYRFNEQFFMRAGPEVAVTLGGEVTRESNGAAAGEDGSVVQISGVFGFGVNLD